jgi:succinyl-diaminopimelate desuccinylase
MRNKTLHLTKRLVSMKTDSGNKEELKKALGLLLNQVNECTIEKFISNGVDSVLVHNRKKGTRKFKIILNGHIDVLPGKDYQYIPKIVGDKLYGVGAMDMKAGIVCLLFTFNKVARSVDYPIALQIVTDEQPGGFNGTKYQIDEGVRGDFIIAGEPTNLNIVNRAKGVLWLKISAKGKTAHSAYPWKGKNAIWDMMNFLSTLRKQYPIPSSQQWVTTVNLSKISTGNMTFNKIPNNCESWVDIRFTPDNKDILKSIKSILPKGFSIEVVESESAMNVSKDNSYVEKLQKIGKEVLNKEIKLYGAQGTSDARFYNQIGCNGIEFGPIGGGIGSDKEWVSISSLKRYCMVLNEFLLSL